MWRRLHIIIHPTIYELKFVNLILIHFILIFCNMIFFELIVKLCNLDINYSHDNAYDE